MIENKNLNLFTNYHLFCFRICCFHMLITVMLFSFSIVNQVTYFIHLFKIFLIEGAAPRNVRSTCILRNLEDSPFHLFRSFSGEPGWWSEWFSDLQGPQGRSAVVRARLRSTQMKQKTTNNNGMPLGWCSLDRWGFQAALPRCEVMTIPISAQHQVAYHIFFWFGTSPCLAWASPLSKCYRKSLTYP